MSQPDNQRLNQSSIYLCAPVNALVEGIYDEKIPLAQIREHGDFGLGTFDHLDGEMVMLDGKVYQCTADGRVLLIEEEISTPFACVTFYQTHSMDVLDHEVDYAGFSEWLLSLLPSRNMFYAIRLEGMFSHVKVRSVPKQESYRPLVEVAKDQPVFNFNNIEGALVGFYTPTYMSSLNVPGLHLHFLSQDLQHGGHLLECSPQKLNAGIQFISKLELSLPMTLDYLTWDFRRDISRDLKKAEN
jgi:acetolactate decarboxylase